MNWIGRSSDVARWIDDERSDLCDHVEADRTLAKTVITEDDTFGPVIRFVCCAFCAENEITERDKELHVCEDCNKSLPRIQGEFWRWYDFYAPQGDEPLFICLTCKNLPTHRNRVTRDREMMEAERGKYYDAFDC